MDAKKALRTALRARAGTLAQRNQESIAICHQLAMQDCWKSAHIIGAYIPIQREADMLPLIHRAWEEGKTIGLPCIDERGQMVFHRTASMSDLQPGLFGIPAPHADLPVISPPSFDLLLVPLEGVDPKGMRLGKGSGFYDRYLPRTQCPAIGIALSWQWADCIPAEPWDQPLDAVADKDGLIFFTKKGLSNHADTEKEESQDQTDPKAFPDRIHH